MRTVFSLMLILTSQALLADVIKPISTQVSAKGVIAVSGVKFNYSVLDRGWVSSERTQGGHIFLAAEKSFFLDYESIDVVAKEKQGIFWNVVKLDASEKCIELGQIEFENQVKKMDAGYEVSFSAKLWRTSEEATTLEHLWLSANCIVEVRAVK